jgi:two-component system alkaline phosphatase synthesis response regulator PhoP
MEGVARRTILLVEDDSAIVEVLAQYLKDEAFSVTSASDGPSAVAAFIQTQPDLVVLDINLPGFPGTEVLRRIRAERDVPVIMLTARVNEPDRVVGLELGADDYISKPFSPREVVARVKSVLRRTERKTRPEERRPGRHVGGIAIDDRAHELRVDDELVNLTPTQFRILDALASNVGQTLTRAQLLERVSADADIEDRTLDRHIANLRARVERDPAHPRYILTVFGVGYKMVAPS